MTEPIRTCVGCRAREDKTNLVRVVAIGDQVVVDERALLPGRGAYLHSTPNCLESAIRRKAFARALRQRSPLDTEPVQHYVSQVNPSAQHSGAVE
ncbi:MAG: YlxR family protein [Candidatus Nanopelagicales bacterium]|nr:YlxR family protein [Candidatus Nanopelagicales bacterium]